MTLLLEVSDRSLMSCKNEGADACYPCVRPSFISPNFTASPARSALHKFLPQNLCIFSCKKSTVCNVIKIGGVL